MLSTKSEIITQTSRKTEAGKKVTDAQQALQRIRGHQSGKI